MLPSEAYSQNNEDLVIKVLRELITGKGINIETFGKQPTSAEAEALRLLNYNTGKFAQNYVEEQKNLDPRIVEAMGVQKEKKEETDMPQMQEGGMLGDLPPEAIANGNVIQGAPVGEVAVPGGGGPTDDGVPTSLPEGTFVLNAASVEYHGTKHINDLIKKSVRNLVKKGVQISGEDLNPDDDVPVAISNGEYIIPPEVARDIGIKKLEDMNDRGLEYRKKIQEQEKQKMAAQEQAMQSFMGAPIQSEQQMPMQEGGEASPPDEAMPQVPKTPEDTSGLTEGQKAVIEAELLKRRLQQEFFNRESERQRRMMEQEERDKGMIFNEKTGQFDLMAQVDKPVVPAVPIDRNIMQGQPKQDYMDKLIQQSMKARGMAQTGGAIERDPQSTFLVPQIARQAQGLPQGANTYPTSPQEPFIGGVPTGSVLENISNAMPQSLQPTGFMQPMDQKKSLEPNRLSFQAGDIVPQNIVDRIGSEEVSGGNVQDYKQKKFAKGVYSNGMFVPYKDNKDIPTLFGFNLTEKRFADLVGRKSVPEEEVFKRHEQEVQNSYNQAKQLAKNQGIDFTVPQIQEVLTDLVYNMGLTSTSKFKKTLGFLKAKEYNNAAIELGASDYSKDVPNRYNRNKKLLESISKQNFVNKIENVLGRK
jgi:hypothetical protein